LTKASPHSGEHGFTLLELMISLMLLGVMMTMVYSVFATALSSVPRGEDVAAESARMRAATSLLSRQVRSIIPYPVDGEDESTPCFFMGNPSYFDFYTAAPQHNGGEGLAHVMYWSDGHSLSMAEELVLPTAPDTGGDQPAPPAQMANSVQLISGLSGARFEYLRIDGDESEWRDSFDSFEEQTLPGAVRVTLDGLGVGNSYWLQEIPVLPVIYGLGSYDCESGFGNKDLDGNSSGNSDTDDNGLKDDVRQRNLQNMMNKAGAQ
jgi:general secretion pathway protein J